MQMCAKLTMFAHGTPAGESGTQGYLSACARCTFEISKTHKMGFLQPFYIPLENNFRDLHCMWNRCIWKMRTKMFGHGNGKFMQNQICLHMEHLLGRITLKVIWMGSMHLCPEILSCMPQVKFWRSKMAQNWLKSIGNRNWKVSEKLWFLSFLGTPVPNNCAVLLAEAQPNFFLALSKLQCRPLKEGILYTIRSHNSFLRRNAM